MSAGWTGVGEYKGLLSLSRFVGHLSFALWTKGRLGLPGSTVLPIGTSLVAMWAVEHEQHFFWLIGVVVLTTVHQRLVSNPESLLATVMTYRFFR